MHDLIMVEGAVTFIHTAETYRCTRFEGDSIGNSAFSEKYQEKLIQQSGRN